MIYVAMEIVKMRGSFAAKRSSRAAAEQTSPAFRGIPPIRFLKPGSQNRRPRATMARGWCSSAASAPLPKFVIHGSTFRHELRKQRGTSKSMILVPLSI